LELLLSTIDGRSETGPIAGIAIGNNISKNVFFEILLPLPCGGVRSEFMAYPAQETSAVSRTQNISVLLAALVPNQVCVVAWK
jgi:hypothetical protein